MNIMKINRFIFLVRLSTWIAVLIPWLVYVSRFFFLLQPGAWQSFQESWPYVDVWGLININALLIAAELSLVSFVLLHSLYLVLKKYIADSQDEPLHLDQRATLPPSVKKENEVAGRD